MCRKKVYASFILKGNTKEDLKAVGEIGEQIKKLYNDEEKQLAITVVSALGQEKVAQCKVCTN